MKKPFLISTSLTLVVLIAFVYFSQPIKAKADQPTLNYETTTSSLSDVKAMITGMEAALIPIVFIVIGFIALTYCTLRNVNVPLQYPSGTSFIDKCSELGHYVFDNATDAIKDVLYSVATFVASGQIVDPNRISSTIPFLLKSVGKFFAAFGAWLGSSFIHNVNDVTTRFLDVVVPDLFSGFTQYNYTNEFISVFNTYSGITYNQTIGSYAQTDTGAMYKYIVPRQFNPALYSWVITSTGFFLYSYEVDTFTKVTSLNIGKMYYFKYTSNYDFNSQPNLNTYNVQDLGYIQYFDFGYANLPFGLDINFFAAQLVSLGMNVYFADTAANTLSINDLTIYQEFERVTPWSDQVYSPTDDQTEVDIDDIANKLGEGATIGSLAALIALLTQDKALTLGTAITDVQTINSAGDYNFPSMDNIWKYPQYFFDMLHGWGSFVKGCLNAVTVGEGGLSWLFYGGFVLLICGGIIGKILLG